MSTIDAIGEVCWVSARDASTVALGLRWRTLGPQLVERIARLGAQPGCRVVAVGASPHFRARLPGIVGGAIGIEFVDDAGDVPRFDVAVVLRCDGGTELPLATIIDEAPQQIVVGVVTDELLRLLRLGKIGGVLSDDDSDAVVAEIIVRCCRAWNARLSLRQTALTMARELHQFRRGGAADEDDGDGDEADDGGEEFGGVRRRRRQRDIAPLRSGELVAESPPMREVLASLAVVAPRKVVVLIEGETGVGKEMIAKTLHQQSDRRDRPFIVQDCGTLTETLLDSELFGHVRGAFTGANADHPGIFVLADGGTVFLDEIQNTSPALQAKLLRVIETGEVRAVGGSRTRVTDVRVVAAANTDLDVAVREGRFRADLFYRLTVFPIRLPPLRARGQDILTLGKRLVATAAQSHSIDTPRLGNDAIDALLAYHWPGNVRQLKNVLERAVLLSGGQTIGLKHLPDGLKGQGDSPELLSLDARVASFERGLIAAAIDDADGVISRAAEHLQVNRVTLTRKAKAHGLLPELSRTQQPRTLPTVSKGTLSDTLLP